MVICRPKCAPLGSPDQPSTHPPPPSMMLGPALSAAAVGFGAGAGDFPPKTKYAPRDNTAATPPIASFPLRVERKDAFPAWAPKLGASISTGALRESATAAAAFGFGAAAGSAAFSAAVFSAAIFSTGAFSAAIFSATAGVFGLSSSRGFGAGGVILTLGAGCILGATDLPLAAPSLGDGGAVGLPHGFALGAVAGVADFAGASALGSCLASILVSRLASAALLSAGGCATTGRWPDFFEPAPLPEAAKPIFGRSGKPVCPGRKTGNLMSAPAPSTGPGFDGVKIFNGMSTAWSADRGAGISLACGSRGALVSGAADSGISATGSSSTATAWASTGGTSADS